MSKNRYVSGQFNVICDVCGKKIKSGQARKRWDGFIVCPDDYETRHSQDFVRARQDKISVPFTRPRPVDVFVEVAYICTPEGSSGICGRSVVGCSIAGHPIDGPYFSPTLAIAGYAVAGLSITGKT